MIEFVNITIIKSRLENASEYLPNAVEEYGKAFTKKYHRNLKSVLQATIKTNL